MPNEEISLNASAIKKRFIGSFFTLTFRNWIIRLINFISLDVIAISVLGPETIGISNIGFAVLTFFTYFSDVGLGGSLIQKKTITDDDIKTTFTLQETIVGILSLVMIIFAPQIGHFYNLDQDSIWLIRILGISFFLISLKVIPSVLMERNLRFRNIVTVELVEAIFYNTLLIFLAFNGYGIWSFSIAILVKSIVGVVLIYILAPTKIRFGVNLDSAKKLLSFGVPFQLNNLLALLKDRLVPLVVGHIVSKAEFGFITWAQGMALMPLESLTTMSRITFPAFSRLQEDKVELAKLVNKSLFLTALITYPLLFGMAAVMPTFLGHVINPKWQPAIFGFYLFAFAACWAIISTTYTNTLNSMGHVKTTLKLMIFWTIAEWSLTPYLTIKFGFNGVAIAQFIISFSSAITIYLIKRFINVKVIDSIFVPISCSVIMAIIVNVFSFYVVRGWWTLGWAIAFGGIIYAILIFVFARKRILADYKELRHG